MGTKKTEEKIMIKLNHEFGEQTEINDDAVLNVVAYTAVAVDMKNSLVGILAVAG